MKLRVLFFSNWYEPGFNGGGSQLAAINHIHAMQDEFDFRVITRDRDLGDLRPYPNIRTGSWTEKSDVPVRYLSPAEQNLQTISGILSSTEYDLIHLNSVFSLPFSFFPLLIRRQKATRSPVIVSPHGEMAPNARHKKSWRKSLYLAGGKSIALFRDVIWHAISSTEKGDIRKVFGQSSSVNVVPVFPSAHLADVSPFNRMAKERGRLRAVFLSRIDRMKNLDLAIDLVSKTPGVTLDIYGPIEQPEYWSECLRQIESSAGAIQYCGSVAPKDVLQTLSQYDVLLHPSQSESFGYVILEALAAGCPVLIGDKTPWRDIFEAGVGVEIPVGEASRFREVLADLRDLTEPKHAQMRERARTYANNYVATTPAKTSTRRMYLSAIRAAEHPAE